MLHGGSVRALVRRLNLRTITAPCTGSQTTAAAVELAAPKREFEERRTGLELAVLLEIKSGLTDFGSEGPHDQRDCLRLGEMQLEDREIFRIETHAVARMAAKVPHRVKERVGVVAHTRYGSLERAHILLRQQVGGAALVFDRDQLVFINGDDEFVARSRPAEKNAANLGAPFRDGAEATHHILQHPIDHIEAQPD